MELSFNGLPMRAKALALGCAAAIALSAAPAFAQDYPSGPIELVVPWKTGGGTDRSARLFAPYLSEALGVPVNVVNIDGGGGWVAWDQMAKWDPGEDDHKIGLVNLPHVFAYLDPKMGRSETVEDFNFISGQTFDPCLWVVRTGDERFSSLEEFVNYAKENPGEVVVSTTAVGSDDYQGLAFAEKKIDGFEVGKVYANNDAKKVQELLGEHTDAVAGNISYYVSYIEDGQMQPLAVLSRERSPFLPDVPTFKEAVGVENICFAGRTLVAAPGLPDEKYKVLADAIAEAQANPEYRDKEKAGSSQIWEVSGEDLQNFIKQTEESVKEVEYWKQDS
ncbi:Bug family tripartite tricarboxylate transporter substrate binding protein [Afifella pfennigii]|uniref:Bug family tripartite tricarboxylate transporter substrate binding protein n=1 Tax=Afifella pfennigii TaxID=209897 RepID=UPI00054DA4B0|nr:tripartite tricarboxylate transporter substrate binding protein [Afifella pfennigii]